MNEKLQEINNAAQAAVAAISGATGIKELEDIRVEVFGKKGTLTALMKAMGGLSADERPVFGQASNAARMEVEAALNARLAELKAAEMTKRLADEALDITIPGQKPIRGGRHPMTIVTEDLCKIFMGMGFEIAEGPEVETAYHSFTALNISETHPARSEQDTFYFNENHEFLLRTCTSPVQVRVMEERKPPIRIICPGKVYRSDNVDATHSPVFHQMEGLVVDKGITFGDLKGALTVFARELFGEETVVRFRPHYFPFTEPSGEMDVQCFACQGIGCRVCKGDGWVELLGCGMVHPNVLKMCGIDPDVYSGYAFGMGLERVAMARFGVNDLRVFFENDVRFLGQFA
ncbi:MAG: phenylalanine--tRNA ligase subunit alpha [Defluviitaleaceae bacterium]|nr:phenylalanine--tRNA ligase subunit alpha [Defluviitaleaceae bacterium]